MEDVLFITNPPQTTATEPSNNILMPMKIVKRAVAELIAILDNVECLSFNWLRLQPAIYLW